MNELISRYLQAVSDARDVVVDTNATYFGGTLEENSLVPLADARLGPTRLADWLRREA
jgi:hypothetical protein